MRKLLPLLITLFMSPAIAAAQTLDLSGYQEPGGAITVGYRGDKVDPYFATKALLDARDGGLETYAPALAWIQWAMHMQRPDGLFDRYSRDAGGQWHSYAAADADDAMLALWLELLYRAAPATGLPKAWQASASKAEAQLQALYDPAQGIYHISRELPVGLLMDNVEIYSAFRHIAREQKRMGLQSEAAMYDDKANLLNAGILLVFKQPAIGVFLVSTQAGNDGAFYPDHAAQIFPLLYRLQNSEDENRIYHNWITANGKEWLRQRNDDYPWGLVAITALNMNDAGSAACWQNSAEPMRYSKHWNVLEEASLQQVKWRLTMHQDTAIPCVGKNLL